MRVNAIVRQDRAIIISAHAQEVIFIVLKNAVVEIDAGKYICEIIYEFSNLF